MEMPERAPARSAIGSIVRGFAPNQDRKDFMRAREGIISLGAQRIDQIGTPRAQWLSRYYRRDPRAFLGYVNQFGGMPAFEQRLRNEAASQAYGRYQQTPEGEDRPDLRSEYNEIYGDPAVAERMVAGQEANARAKRPRWARGPQGALRDPDDPEGRRAWPGLPMPPPPGRRGDLTPRQTADDAEIEQARRRSVAHQSARDEPWDREKTRQLVGRGKETFGFPEEGEEEEGGFYAADVRLGLQHKTGPDPGWQAFNDRMVGVRGLDVPVLANTTTDSHPGDPDPDMLVSGVVYNTEAWFGSALKRGRWNAQIQEFEPVR
jgi:hypothetical protein